MKDFLASVIVKFTSWIILGAGAIFSVAVAFGSFKAEFEHTKKRVDDVEIRLDKNDKKINTMYGHLEFLRGKFDKNYDPKPLEEE